MLLESLILYSQNPPIAQVLLSVPTSWVAGKVPRETLKKQYQQEK